jgi:predicted anti-sigma-YlaC factor YlaD
MFCDEVLELIEPIAAGELTPDDRIASHLAMCGGCAATLDDARRLEQLLQTRATVTPPPQFTGRIMGRIRRERWRREQFLDAGFNAIVGLVALVVLVAFWILISSTGVAGLAGDALDLLNAAALGVLRRAAPSLPLYGGAAALVATALGIWWWAERSAEI